MRFLLLFLLCAAPCFAAGTEVPAVAAPLLSPEVIALLVPLVASAIASGFNAFLRAQKKRGKRSGPVALAMGAALNTVALNLDQAKRQAKAAKGGPQ